MEQDVAESIRLSHEDQDAFLSPVMPLDGAETTIVESGGVRSDSGTPVTWKLYTSHFLSTWNSRVFEFSAVLFIAHIYPGTLLPPSIYALLRAASAISFSSWVGEYIDRGQRLSVIRISIVGQRLSVLLSSCVLFILARRLIPLQSLNTLLFITLCLLSPLEKLCSIMSLISVEKDWVVVIAQSSSQSLEALNSQMRRIDLICKLLGPLCIALIDGISTTLAISIVFFSNFISVFIEYFAIARVYEQIPALQEDRRDPGTNSHSRGDQNRIRVCAANLQRYLNNPVFPPSFSLSFLYLTVLSFSGQMVTFLLSAGFTSTRIGLVRTLAIGFELMATCLAPVIMKRIGPVRAGLWSVNWQICCLVPAVSCFWFFNAHFIAVPALVSGVIFSRVGLWGFDLSVQVLVQESVEPAIRGAFSSTEASVQNFFELCAYLSTILFSRPDQFKYPVLISTFATLLAGGLYAKFVRDARGHLIHVSKCFGGKDSPAVERSRRVAGIRMQGLP